MKKLLSFLALALCFVACQNESVEVVSNGDLADVVLTIDAPELGVTRADGDLNAAKNSAFGAIDFLTDADWANYDLRYILEVYDANEDGTGTPIYRERMVNCLDKYAPTTFELRLVPNRDYKFVVFADFVAEGNAELTEPDAKRAIADLYYNTADLRNVTAITTEPTWGAMNEIRDAYFVTENVHITTGLNKTLTLTRPFAKLRVIATDLDYITGYSAPGYVEITYKNEPIYKSFNAVNGELNTDVMTGNELKYGYEVSKTIPYTAGYDEFSTNQTLFTDYLLAVEGEHTVVNFDMVVYESKGGREIHRQDFSTQIPIQRNHLTTLIGDILTTQANIQIKIDDNFADEFVIGVGDDNTTTINTWGAGQLNANGEYTFEVDGENKFMVTVNSASVVNQKLATGDYVLAEDAEKDENGNIVAGQNTFTVEALKANETTRALVDVEVIGGKMNVQAVDDNYKITLDLVLQFAEEKDVRHAIYTYEGPVAFGEVLDTPDVKAAAEGNVVTLTWTAVEGAKKYTITGFTEEPVVTDKTTYEFTGEYDTEYTYSVVASNDTLNSQPYNGTVTTEAEPVVEPEEPTALATPVVNASVEGNVVTLTWAAVENAGSYKVFIGDEVDGISETVTPEEGATEVTFVKADLDYATTYTFTVYAIPANTEEFANSEGGTTTATTEAETTTEPIEPEELAEIDPDAYYTFKQATEMKGGKWYAIVSDNIAGNYISGNYGWMYTTNAIARLDNTISLPATCAFGFLTTEGGYTIQQYDSKFLYMQGTYNNFNVAENCPEDGALWTVEKSDNAYKITNVTMDKYIQYASNYSSYGSYDTETGVLPTLYELVEVDNTPMILSVAPSSLSFKADGESKTAEIETYGTSTINVSDDADWVTTSLEGNTVTVTADANSGDARETTVTITYGDDSRTISVSQAEYKDPSVTPENPENTIGVYTSMDFLFVDQTLEGDKLTSGTNAYKQNINAEDGATIDVLKLGTSKLAGSYTTAAVGVSGKSKLSFYAVGWKGKTVELTVTVDGNATEFTLTANTGATGNAPYNDAEGELKFNDETDYYTIDVTGITADSTVTFATDSTGCRALICGVQLY